MYNKETMREFYQDIKSKNNYFLLIDGEDTLDKKGMKKLNNAKSNYAKYEDNETPLFFFDDTMFGSSKDGFFITDKKFYVKSISDLIIHPLEDIKTLTNKGKLLVCNGKELGIVTMDVEDAITTTKIISSLIGLEYSGPPIEKKVEPKDIVEDKKPEKELKEKPIVEQKESSIEKPVVETKPIVKPKKASYKSETFMVDPGFFTDADKLVGERLQPVLDKGVKNGYILHNTIQTAIKNGINITVTWEIDETRKENMIYKSETFMVDPGFFTDADKLVGERLQPRLDDWSKKGWILHSLIQTAIKNGINITMIWQKDSD